MKTAEEMNKKGGYHFSTVREWIQYNCINGDSVYWGTSDILKFKNPITVKDLEYLSCQIAAAVLNDPTNQ